MTTIRRRGGEERTTVAPFPFPTTKNHAGPPVEADAVITEEPSEDALDHGIEESFPASDPVSVSVAGAVRKKDPPGSLAGQ